MAVTLEELEIKFTASMGNLQSQIDGVRSTLTSVETSANRAQKSLSGLGRTMKLALSAYVIRPLIRIGRESLQMANDVVESEDLFNVSMGGMAQSARDWSDSLGDSLGLNAYSLRKNVGIMNVMFKSMGFGSNQAYDMSTAMVELSEDMASFYNLSPEDAFQKLQSGLTGMGMPLKQLGILIDDSILKQYAHAAGVKNTTREMTAQEKVLARYTAIMAQTSMAHGDLARTIDRPVNQIRILQNTLDMAKVGLGKAMQTIQATVLPILARLATAAANAAQAIAYLVGGLGGLTRSNMAASFISDRGAKASENLSAKLDKTAESYKKAGAAAAKAGKQANVGIKAFDEVNLIMEKAAGSGGIGTEGITVPDNEPISDFGDNVETVSLKIQEAAKRIKEYYELLEPVLIGIAAAFIAFKLTGSPAIAAVIGVFAALYSGLIRELDRLDTIQARRAFGTIDLDFEEAATIVAHNLKTSTTKALEAFSRSREQVNASIQRYAESVYTTKKVFAMLELFAFTKGDVDTEGIKLTEAQKETVRSAITEELAEAGQVKLDVQLMLSDAAKSLLGEGFKGSAVESSMREIFGNVEQTLEESGKRLNELLVQSFEVGMTPEIMGAIATTLRTMRQATAMIANDGLTNQGLWEKQLAENATLSREAVENMVRAYAEFTASQEKEMAQAAETLKNVYYSAISMGYDKEKAQAAIAEIDAGLTASIRSMKDGAAIDAARTIIPQIMQAILSGEIPVGQFHYYTSQVEALLSDVDLDILPGNVKYMFEHLEDVFYPGMGRFMLLLDELGVNIEALLGNIGQEGMDALNDALNRNAVTEQQMRAIMLDPMSPLANEVIAWLRSVGEDATATYIEKLRDGIPAMEKTGKDSAAAVKAGFDTVDFKPSGAAATKGLEAGMNSQAVKNNLLSTAKSLATAAKNAFSKILGIASPSRVFMEMGEASVMGFALGLDGGVADIQAAGERLASAALGSVDTSGLDTALYLGGNRSLALEGGGVGAAIEAGIARGVQSVMDALNVVLQVDGQELGRVAISGINRATRSAGTVLLEM